jgi:Nucleoside-diphosphate-sugar epimerases
MRIGQRALVTGGGFLASHLCERLLADGHQALCPGNFFSSVCGNIAPFMDNRRFKLLRHM